MFVLKMKALYTNNPGSMKEKDFFAIVGVATDIFAWCTVSDLVGLQQLLQRCCRLGVQWPKDIPASRSPISKAVA